MASRTCEEAIIAWLRKHNDQTLESIYRGIGFSEINTRRCLYDLVEDKRVTRLDAIKRTGRASVRCYVYQIRADLI